MPEPPLHIESEKVKVIISEAVSDLLTRQNLAQQIADTEDTLLTFKDMMRLGRYGDPKRLREDIRMKRIPAFKLGQQWFITRKAWRKAIFKLQSKAFR